MLDDIGATAPPPPEPEHVEVGALRVPSRLAQWKDEVTAGSQAHAVAESLVYAVLDRETEGGTAPGYTPHGPAGTGDWTARREHWLTKPHVRIVTELPPGWHAPRDPHTHEPLPGPYAIPDDGLGWGRGLAQHDYHRALAFDWRDPAVNIDKCAELLRQLIDEFPRNQAAAIAAYNCGPRNVRQALLEQLDVDAFTTGGDYSADVLARRARFTAPLDSPSGGADGSA